MNRVVYIDRITKQKEQERVYGESAIRLLYGHSIVQRTLGRCILHVAGKWPIVSRFYGALQKCPRTQRKIIPFIKEYGIDPDEFQDPIDSFCSFNDFFVRHLKREARPIVPNKDVAVIPADGRYLAYQHIEQSDLFSIKGSQYTIRRLLEDAQAKCFEGGSLVLARLCPTDCHRFYFPVDGIPQPSRLIEGKLFSVNPIAVRSNPWIFFENRRYVTYIDSPQFGKIAFIEIGATNVGSIHQTFTPFVHYEKGQEKGYFSFGGSALAILFEPGAIKLDQDLLVNSLSLETRCLIGQSLGKSSHSL